MCLFDLVLVSVGDVLGAQLYMSDPTLFAKNLVKGKSSADFGWSRKLFSQQGIG